MRRLVVIVTLLASATVVAPAHADTVFAYPALDRTCALASAHDPAGAAAAQAGHVQAGPFDLPAPYTASSGSVTCTVQVGEWSHAGTDADSATGPVTPGTVALPPSPVTFAATGADLVYLCTSVEVVGGPTLYWVPGDPLVAGYWSTSDDRSCGLVSTAETPEGQPLAYCTFETMEASVEYAPPLTATTGPVDWQLSLEVDCVGSAPLAGHYALTFEASNDQSCVMGGTSTATVTGTGPNGAVTGSSMVSRAMHHYDAFHTPGTFTDAGGTYAMRWLFLARSQPFQCPFSSLDLDGLGILG